MRVICTALDAKGVFDSIRHQDHPDPLLLLLCLTQSGLLKGIALGLCKLAAIDLDSLSACTCVNSRNAQAMASEFACSSGSGSVRSARSSRAFDVAASLSTAHFLIRSCSACSDSCDPGRPPSAVIAAAAALLPAARALSKGVLPRMSIAASAPGCAVAMALTMRSAPWRAAMCRGVEPYRSYNHARSKHGHKVVFR